MRGKGGDPPQVGADPPQVGSDPPQVPRGQAQGTLQRVHGGSEALLGFPLGASFGSWPCSLIPRAAAQSEGGTLLTAEMHRGQANSTCRCLTDLGSDQPTAEKKAVWSPGGPWSSSRRPLHPPPCSSSYWICSHEGSQGRPHLGVRSWPNGVLSRPLGSAQVGWEAPKAITARAGQRWSGGRGAAGTCTRACLLLQL